MGIFLSCGSRIQGKYEGLLPAICVKSQVQGGQKATAPEPRWVRGRQGGGECVKALTTAFEVTGLCQPSFGGEIILTYPIIS
jgi:hypothetical protein